MGKTLAKDQRGELVRTLFEKVYLNLGDSGKRVCFLATPIGFEPTISTLTGWHVKPLHHGAARELCSHVMVVEFGP